jgi:hypothetical protein
MSEMDTAVEEFTHCYDRHGGHSFKPST